MKIPNKSPLIYYTHTLRSRYSETDRMGYVYYGNYLQYFEVARTEMIRNCGFSYREMEESGVMLPVIHTEIEYKAPVLYDEEIHIKVMVFDEPSVRLHTFYEVTTAATNAIHVLGEVTLCFVDVKTRRPRKAPQKFLDGIRHLKT